MNSANYDVAVAYRIYPRVSKNPAMFPEDKLRLARLCLHSFRASLGTVRARMFVLLDDCPPEFDELFKECFDPTDLEFIRLDGAGNRQTFLRQIEILLEQDAAEAVYFAEDDYFYLPGQFEVMLNLLNNDTGADFISPYDHPDYYSLALHSARQSTQEFGDRRWRTAASTCLTFLTTKQILAETKRIFQTYAYGNPDVCLWLSLTKQAVFDPRIIWKSFQQRIAYGGFVAASWLYGWPQILAGRRRKLWVPSPSIATHMDQQFLAPGVDWKRQFESVGKLAS
jgi:hypothetical protein